MKILEDAWREAADQAAAIKAGRGVVGFGVLELRDERTGRLKLVLPFANLITTAGDQYYAQKGIVGIAPANASAPTAVSGMKLGTGTTAAAKSGAGAALVTYVTGSNRAFDSTYPQASAVGGDLGWLATYKTTWPAGTVTNSTLNEAVIVNDSATDATSSAANSISRFVFGATVNKTATDSLAATWSHKFLGA